MPPKTGSQPRPNLAVAMIVRDAADLLDATLDCVRPITDQIVVVDCGSTDGSTEIARDGGATVVETTWQDCYSTARNECLQHVRADWVLWLEAGETLDDVAVQQIRNFVDDSADSAKAYLMFVQRPTNSSNCWEQIGQVRLVPHKPELRFTGRVRERMLPSIVAAGMGVDALDCIIRRSEAHCHPTRLRTKARRNLNMINMAITEEGEQPMLVVARAAALAELGRQKEAGLAYRRAIGLADRGSPEMLEAYYGLLTAMDHAPDAADAQLTTCLEAIAIYPLDAQLLCGMGSYLLRQQRLDLAARSYEMAVTHGTVDPTIWHLSDLADVAVACWSLVLQLLGDAGRAESVLKKAAAERPDSLRLRRQLIELYVKAGREKDALAQCRQLPSEMSQRDLMPDVIRGARLAAAKNFTAALPKLTAAYQAGCREPLCLRWLAATQLGVGNLAEVEVVVAEWERHEPDNMEIGAFRQAAAQRGQQANNYSEKSAGRRVDGPSLGKLPIEAAAFASRPTTPTA